MPPFGLESAIPRPEVLWQIRTTRSSVCPNIKTSMYSFNRDFCIKSVPHAINAAFPLSRSAPRFQSWSLSWTNRSTRISSYQILMSILVIVLIAEHFWAVQKVLRLERSIFNRNYCIRSYCTVAKHHTLHLHVIKLPNRGDRDRSWTRQNPSSVEMSCDLVRSAPTCDGLSVPFAQCLSRVTREQVRVDKRKRE